VIPRIQENTEAKLQIKKRATYSCNNSMNKCIESGSARQMENRCLVLEMDTTKKHSQETESVSY
jgi:hypothetical protein